MEDEQIVDVERRLVGRVPFRYQLNKDARTLEADSGFGKVGAKMDPKTGALMYEKYEDWITKQQIFREEVKEASIRFSKDSQAIIDIREHEEGRISFDGAVQDHISKGTITVFNKSARDRIWDINVGVRSEGEEAQLDFDSLQLMELEPGQRESKEYPIYLHEPALAVEEIVSTHPDFAETLIILPEKSNHVGLQLGVKNLDTIRYDQVIVTKAVPVEMKNIIFPDNTAEDVAIDNGKLRWKIKDLGPGEIRILRYEGDIDVRKTDSFPTGDVSILGTSSDLTTTVVVHSFEAMCRNMYMIEADETDEPGVWICRFVIENTSQFEVEVLRVEVKDPQNDEIYLDMDDPGISLPPGERWQSKDWTVPGRERPSFIKNMVLNVVPGIHKETNVDLRKDGGRFFPAALSFGKTFDRKKVEARRETPIKARIVLENTAAAEMEQIFVRDSIPPYMAAPSPHSVQVMRDNAPISADVSVEVQPEDYDPMAHQQMFIRIDNLSQYGGPLRKGEQIAIEYITEIVRPEPESKIAAACEVDVKTLLPGPVISGKDIGGIPVIETTHVLRKFTVGKSVEQGRSTGEYAIQLLYRNRGNQRITDLVMKDILPENFSAKAFSLQPEQERSPEGFTVLHWRIPEIAPGESLVINYDINGEGEYHPRDAQIFYNATMD